MALTPILAASGPLRSGTTGRASESAHPMSLRSMLRRLIPTREQLQAGRFTRWLAPFLRHAKLWH